MLASEPAKLLKLRRRVKMENKILEKFKELASKYDVNNDEPGEYWDSGNYDDCFEVGLIVGANDVYRAIKDILEEKGDE